MEWRNRLALIAAIAALMPVLGASRAWAGAFELSLGGSYNRSNYSLGNYAWERRYGTSVAYHFTERSSIEFAFQDIVVRTLITGYEDTTFHDQIASLNWVQALLPRNYSIQPYVKVGIGQLNREAQGYYLGGLSPPSVVDSVTGVLGAGLRIYITRAFAVRAEATTYLAGGSIRTWKDNIGATFGLSLYF